MNSLGFADRIRVIDSHTGGEPTRVVIEGGPDLGQGDMSQRRQRFAEQCDDFRTAVILEPRGGDLLVGALLCEPVDPNSAAGVIFFNNAGPLWMCGHGAIGVAVTLAHLGRIQPGKHRLETPVGVVGFEYHGENQVTIENVPSYRSAKDVEIDVEGVGMVKGDVAWGGNWFFLVGEHNQVIDPQHIAELTEFTRAIRRALEKNGVSGEGGNQIDHIELFGPPSLPDADVRNFVLCPGGAYDRSPCGTGTSAKLACLAADGNLQEGQVWRQESIIGSLFEGSVRREGEKIIPRVKGAAYVHAETILILHPQDPFRTGITVSTGAQA